MALRARSPGSVFGSVWSSSMHARCWIYWRSGKRSKVKQRSTPLGVPPRPKSGSFGSSKPLSSATFGEDVPTSRHTLAYWLLRVLDQPRTLLKLAGVGQECRGNSVVSGEVSHSKASPRFIAQLEHALHALSSDLEPSDGSVTF